MQYKNKVDQVEPGVLVVTLTQGQVALVDDAQDVKEILATYKFRTMKDPRSKRCYAISRVSKKTRKHLHRLVLGQQLGPDAVVNHKDGNSLNCCRANLVAYESNGPMQIEVAKARPRVKNVWKHGNGYDAVLLDEKTWQRTYKTFRAKEGGRTLAEARAAAETYVKEQKGSL